MRLILLSIFLLMLSVISQAVSLPYKFTDAGLSMGFLNSDAQDQGPGYIVQADLKVAFSKYFGIRTALGQGKFGDVEFGFGGREGSDLFCASFEAIAGLLDSAAIGTPDWRVYITVGRGYYKITRQYDPDREGWETACGIYAELRLFNDLWGQLGLQTQEYRANLGGLHSISIGFTYTFHKRSNLR